MCLGEGGVASVPETYKYTTMFPPSARKKWRYSLVIWKFRDILTSCSTKMMSFYNYALALLNQSGVLYVVFLCYLEHWQKDGYVCGRVGPFVSEPCYSKSYKQIAMTCF